MNITVEQAVAKILDAKNLDELKRFSRACRVRQEELLNRQRMAFSKGDLVEFDTKRGTVQGTVTKVCQKNIKVRQEGRAGSLPCNWTVSPNLLRHA